ncbi:MAG TPA: ABC transporter permease [Thermodesulfovibrionales bacterium]|nr:ABC transporter permease [Thermodesulfovibrionales bacterium]
MKRVFLNLKIAVRSLLNFKLRTSLAILGVFLGTFSLIVVSNLSDSLMIKTEKEAESFGKNLLIVRSGVVRKIGTSTRLMSEATTLTIEDAQAVVLGSRFISDVSASGNKLFPVRYENTVLKSILVVGVPPNYPAIRNFPVAEGRFISPEDDRTLNKVAVIGTKVAERLFGKEDPIGKHVLIWRVPCQVIGIMQEKGVDISGVDQDNQIFVPLNTYLRRFVNKDYINTISVQVTDEQFLPPAKTQIEEILRIRHKMKNSQNDDFTVIDLKDVMALKTQAMSMIKVLGRISAVVSFLIGGLGILSIMILIVNERKVEIGIRRAVGSRKRDIVLQFLLEASFISFSGGTVGVLLSSVASILIFWFAKLPFTLSPAGHLISFLASITVGILAGIYPSQKAIRIQPVDVIKA